MHRIRIVNPTYQLRVRYSPCSFTTPDYIPRDGSARFKLDSLPTVANCALDMPSTALGALCIDYATV